MQVSVSADRTSPVPTPPVSSRAAGQAQPEGEPGQHEGAGNQADLALQRPAGLAADHGGVVGADGGGVGGEAAVEDVDPIGTDTGQVLLGLAGARAGSADQHDLAVQPGRDLLGVLGEQGQRQVVGATDVCGLELRRCTDIENGHRVGPVQPAPDGGGLDVVGLQGCHRISFKRVVPPVSPVSPVGPVSGRRPRRRRLSVGRSSCRPAATALS